MMSNNNDTAAVWRSNGEILAEMQAEVARLREEAVANAVTCIAQFANLQLANMRAERAEAEAARLREEIGACARAIPVKGPLIERIKFLMVNGADAVIEELRGRVAELEADIAALR
jgi:hypothetical protein